MRWALALFVSIAVSVPASLLAGPVCGMESDGSGCVRCEAKLAADPAPSCHAKPELQPTQGACHEGKAATECCSIETREVHAVLFAGPALGAVTWSAHGDWAEAPAWFSISRPAVASPPDAESPPGRAGLLVAQTTILRL